MAATEIFLDGRTISVQKAIFDAKFRDRTVLTSDVWSYVELWLTRKKSSEAIFYWQQAKQFFYASQTISVESAPLTIYYCFLNLIKALLVDRQLISGPYHGVSGRSQTSKKTTLHGEMIQISTRGVTPALSRLMADTDARNFYSLKQVLYNLAFIHRSYVLTYRSAPELYVPLQSTSVVRKDGSQESWFQMIPDPRFDLKDLLSNLPTGIEQDIGITGRTVLRTKKRFKWKDGKSELKGNLQRLTYANSVIRHNVFYIRGSPATWYLKLSRSTPDVIDRSSLVLAMIGMHRLSELARYDPLRLTRLLNTQQNWLLSEFIGSAPIQFVDEVATLITGQNLAVPFVKGLR